MPLTNLGKADLAKLYTEREISDCRRIIAKAETAEGELHPLCRMELLRQETGLFSDQIRAIVHEIEPSLYTARVDWDRPKASGKFERAA